MIAIDIIGVIATICLIGLRYPQYFLCASLLHEISPIFIAIFLQKPIDSIISAGAFGTIIFNSTPDIWQVIIMLSGPLTNYIVSCMVGGVEFEPTANLLNPITTLKNPFAVINLRLFVLSFVFTLWRIIYIRGVIL